MPLKAFLCPDGQKRTIAECLEKCPRPKGRCLSLPTLYDIGQDRYKPIYKCPDCGYLHPQKPIEVGGSQKDA